MSSNTYKRIKDMIELKKNIAVVIRQMFRDWDFSDIEEVTDSIIDNVADEVMETSNYPNYNDSDVRIAVKRVIITKLNKSSITSDIDYNNII